MTPTISIPDFQPDGYAERHAAKSRSKQLGWKSGSLLVIMLVVELLTMMTDRVYYSPAANTIIIVAQDPAGLIVAGIYQATSGSSPENPILGKPVTFITPVASIERMRMSSCASWEWHPNKTYDPKYEPPIAGGKGSCLAKGNVHKK